MIGTFKDLLDLKTRRAPACPYLTTNESYFGDLMNPNHFEVSVIRPHGSRVGEKSLSSRDNQFKLMLNVKHFSPEEIEVKTADDFIVVHGKHEEQIDEHGFVAREFTRRYKIPEDVESKKLMSSLSKNGILTIQAPRKVEPLPKNERIVPITIQQSAAMEEAKKIQEQQSGEDQK